MKKELVAGIPKNWKHHPATDIFYCPGCQQPIVHRMIAEVLEHMGREGEAIAVCGIGCGMVGGYASLDIDGCNCAHGRAPDVATAIKHAHQDKALVFTIQGDGDAFSIGIEPLVAASIRAEKITVIMINNSVFGNTGGQLAPTTLMGQVTSTSPGGRTLNEGITVQVAELIAQIKGVAYSARGCILNPANYRRTVGYLQAAFQKQIDNVGLSYVEILAACPTQWHLTPKDSLQWIEEQMIPQFPLGEFKNLDSIG